MWKYERKKKASDNYISIPYMMEGAKKVNDMTLLERHVINEKKTKTEQDNELKIQMKKDRKEIFKTLLSRSLKGVMTNSARTSARPSRISSLLEASGGREELRLFAFKLL